MGVALVYHRVGELTGDARHELMPALGLRLFEAQLGHLRENYRVVPPSALLDAARERQPGDRFPVAITFDDDLPSHLEIAAPALARVGLPAAFFLCGACVDGSHGFWWEDLQALVDRWQALPSRLRSLPEVDLAPALQKAPRAIHRIAEFIERLPPERRDSVARELRSLAANSHRGLSPGDVGALAGARFEIGFHTRRHYLLSTLSDGALRAAMDEGREQLETLVGRRLTMIAYPHGKADGRVAEAARAAGYELGFTAVPASVGAATKDPLMIGRVEAEAVPVHDFGRKIAATLELEPSPDA